MNLTPALTLSKANIKQEKGESVNGVQDLYNQLAKSKTTAT